MSQAVSRTKEERRAKLSARWWHDKMVEYIVLNPAISQKELARLIGRSEGTVNLVVKSDMFQARLAQRRDALRERIDQTISQKLLKVADLGLEVVTEQLETKRGALPFAATTEFVGNILERLGYGTKPSSPSTQVQVNVGSAPVAVPVSSEALAAARQALLASNAARARETPAVVIEAPSAERVEVPDAPGE